MAKKDFRNGLQSRLNDLEVKVEDMVDGALQSDEIACDTLTAASVVATDVQLVGVGGNVLEVKADDETPATATLDSLGAAWLADGISIGADPQSPTAAIPDTGIVACAGVNAGSGSISTNGSVVGSTLTGHLLDPNFVTPVNAVLATGGQLAYDNGTNVTAGKKVTIPNGDETDSVYTFRAVVALAGEVKIGADADASMLNLTRAINKSGGTEGAGQDYLVSAAHPLVSAAHNAGGDLVTFTVLTRGEIGNIDITTDEATITPTDPSGGVDGTVGAKGDVRLDADAIYVCTAANGTTGQNWKRATLGALA